MPRVGDIARLCGVGGLARAAKRRAVSFMATSRELRVAHSERHADRVSNIQSIEIL